MGEKMMLIDDIYELRLEGVFSRGVPNEERVILRNVSELHIELGRYFLLQGLKVGANSCIPILDSLYWFGDIKLAPNTWIFVYTGPGKAHITTEASTKQPALIAHWGHKQVMFHDEQVAPVLLRADGIIIDSGPKAVPIETILQLAMEKDGIEK